MKLFTNIVCELLLFAGKLYHALGKYEKTLKILKRAKKIAPYNKNASLGLAALHSDNNNYPEARKQLEEILAIYPTDWETHRLLIKVLHKSDESIEKIVPYIEMYLKNKPKNDLEPPLTIRILFKLFKPKVDLDTYMKSINNYSSEWDEWAYALLRKYQDSKDV